MERACSGYLFPGFYQEAISRSIPPNWLLDRAFWQTELLFKSLSRQWDSRGSPMNNHKKLTWRHSVTKPELPLLLLFFFLFAERYSKNRTVCKKWRDIGFVWELLAPSHAYGSEFLFITRFFISFSLFICFCFYTAFAGRFTIQWSYSPYNL